MQASFSSLVLFEVVLQLSIVSAAGDPICYTRNRLNVFSMTIERVSCSSGKITYKQFPSEEDVSVSELIPLYCRIDELPVVHSGNFDCAEDYFSDMCHLKCENSTFPSSPAPVINCERIANNEFKWEDSVSHCAHCGEWIDWGESSYLLVEHEQTWDVAAITCQIEYQDAHLVSVDDQLENDFIKQMIYACEGDTFSWIALNDKEVEGRWEGIKRTAATFYNWGYQNGNLEEPNGGRYDNCVVVSSETGQWHDVRCNWHYKYVCERKIPQT